MAMEAQITDLQQRVAAIATAVQSHEDRLQGMVALKNQLDGLQAVVNGLSSSGTPPGLRREGLIDNNMIRRMRALGKDKAYYKSWAHRVMTMVDSKKYNVGMTMRSEEESRETFDAKSLTPECQEANNELYILITSTCEEGSEADDIVKSVEFNNGIEA